MRLASSRKPERTELVVLELQYLDLDEPERELTVRVFQTDNVEPIAAQL